MALRPPTASARVSTASPSTIKATSPLRMVPASPTTGLRPMLECCTVEWERVEPLGMTWRSGAVVLTMVDSVIMVGSVVLVGGAMVLVVLVGGALVEGVPVVVVVVVLLMVVVGGVMVVVVGRAVCSASLPAVPIGSDAAEVGGKRVVVVGWSLAFLEVLFCLLVLLLTFLLVLRTAGGAAGKVMV